MIHDEPAFAMVKQLARNEGVLAGSSGGANSRLPFDRKKLGPGKRVVTIIPDSAERYMSKKIFEGGL